jgi:hypothetical protein
VHVTRSIILYPPPSWSKKPTVTRVNNQFPVTIKVSSEFRSPIIIVTCLIGTAPTPSLSLSHRGRQKINKQIVRTRLRSLAALNNILHVHMHGTRKHFETLSDLWLKCCTIAIRSFPRDDFENSLSCTCT